MWPLTFCDVTLQARNWIPCVFTKNSPNLGVSCHLVVTRQDSARMLRGITGGDLLCKRPSNSTTSRQR